MACFLVPVAEAIITTVAGKAMKSKEANISAEETAVSEVKIPFSRKIGWLSNMLWGGSALLALEHVWHGELEPFAPFLTAAKDPAALSAVLSEMATSGVAMAVLVSVAWLGMVAVTSAIEKRKPDTASDNG